MPYMSPGAAASDAIEQSMVRRLQEQRQAEQMDLQRRQMALQEQRESRAAADQDEMMKFRRDEAGQRAEAAGLEQHMKRIASMKPGDIPDAQLVAESKKYRTEHLFSHDPSMTMAPGQTHVQLPNGVGSTDSPIGPDGQPVPSPESSAVDMPGAQTAQTIPGAVRFGGMPAQRDELHKQAMRRSLADSIDAGADARTVIGGYLRNGGDPAEAEKIVAALKDKSKAAIRESPDKRDLEIRDGATGLWSPLQGDIPENAIMLAAPQPKAVSAGADVTPPDAAGIDAIARLVGKGGAWPPLGSGNAAYVARKAIIDRLGKYDRETDTFMDNGAAPLDLAGNRANYDADRDSQKKMQANLDAATAFSSTAEANGELLKATLGKIPDSGYQIVNRIWRPIAGAAQSNQRVMGEFNTYRQSLQNEFARIITQPNLAGVLSDKARDEMAKILDPNATVETISASLESLRNEAKNRVTQYQGELGTIKGRITTPQRRSTDRAIETPKTSPTAGMTPEQKRDYYKGLP